MPGHKTHKIIGTVVAAMVGFLIMQLNLIVKLGQPGYNPHLRTEWIFGYAPGFTWLMFMTGLVAAFIFSFLPDIDTAASKARFWFNLICVGGIVYLVYSGKNLWVLVVALGMIFIWFSKHRGFFHRWYAPFILASPFLVVEFYLVYAMAVSSYLSHILIDKVTTKIKRAV